MAEGELQEWHGTGLFFPNLEVLQTVDIKEFRVSAWGHGDSTDMVKAISANSLEEAIAYIKNLDYSYFDEATLYCEEGGTPDNDVSEF